MTRLHHYVISAALMGAALATLWVTLPAQAQPAGTPATDQPCGQGGASCTSWCWTRPGRSNWQPTCMACASLCIEPETGRRSW